MEMETTNERTAANCEVVDSNTSAQIDKECSTTSSIVQGGAEEATTHIINTENDYDLMYNLHHLMAMETQFSDDETDLNKYRGSVKRLMHHFLTKFEETLEYQKYLENEVTRLNHHVRNLIITFASS